MVSTRSKTAQTHLEDTAIQPTALKSQGKKTETPSKAAPKANTSRKRKPTDVGLTEHKSTPKRTKVSPKTSYKPENETAGGDKDSKPVVINRAPVLQLWAASVAHLTYPELSWESCLSAGSAVSSICAVAKGHSIGTVPENDDSDTKEEGREQARKKQKGLKSIEIMHFKLKLKDGLAVVGSNSKGKPGGEDALRRKFGDEQYSKVKEVIEDALKSWEGHEDELNQKAFHMYESFRPDVSKGQKGWGRKGELEMDTVANTVRRS